MPWFSAITSTFSATPTVMISMPFTFRLATQNPRIATYDSNRIAKPRSSMRSFGKSTNSSAIWIARPRNSSQSTRKCSEPSRPKLPFVATTTTIVSAIIATKKITRTTVPTAVRPVAGILRPMYELRSSNEGTVLRVEVDEGQMVAEDDEIAVLDTESGRVVIVTDVPGVVRELYVEAGYSVTPGTVVALIDES